MKFSIVTPSYQQAKFFGEAMDSVLDQNYPEIEYFVVDGGSVDGSVDLIKERESLIQWWVSEPDDGQTHAICKGMKRVTGDIVAWLNSDDLYRPGAFGIVAKAFEQFPEVDVIYGSCDIIDAEGKLLMTRRDIDFDYRIATFGVSPMLQPEVFVRRRVLEKVGLPRADLDYLMDKEWWLRMAQANVIFKRIEPTLAALRRHEDAKSTASKHGFAGERDKVIAPHWHRGRPKNKVLRKIVLWILRQYYRVVRQIRLSITYGRPQITYFAKAKRKEI